MFTSLIAGGIDKDVVEQIDPDYIVPIHIEAKDWFADKFENAVLADESPQRLIVKRSLLDSGSITKPSNLSVNGFRDLLIY